MDPAIRKPRLPAAAGLCAALLLWVSVTQAADGRSSQQRARQAQVIDLLYTLTEEQGAAVVFITHDLGILAGFADRMLVMYAGRVMEKAPTDELYYRSINPYTLGLLESLPRIDGPIPEKLTTIGGRPPSPSNLPSGCPFSARCRYVHDLCREVAPALETPENGTHPSACHLSSWLAEKPGVLR